MTDKGCRVFWGEEVMDVNIPKSTTVSAAQYYEYVGKKTELYILNGEL